MWGKYLVASLSGSQSRQSRPLRTPVEYPGDLSQVVWIALSPSFHFAISSVQLVLHLSRPSEEGDRF